MAKYQVTCKTVDGPDADRRIDKLGGPEFGVHLLDQILAWMNEGHEFWVAGVAGSPSAWLEIKESSRGRLYVRTIPDGKWDNNLAALGPCL
jgi:hypothetical protein